MKPKEHLVATVWCWEMADSNGADSHVYEPRERQVRVQCVPGRASAQLRRQVVEAEAARGPGLRPGCAGVDGWRWSCSCDGNYAVCMHVAAVACNTGIEGRPPKNMRVSGHYYFALTPFAEERLALRARWAYWALMSGHD